MPLKILFIFAMIIGSIFIYAGCSSGSSNTTSNASSAQATAGGSPVNPAKPDRPADLQGKVKQVRGNQVKAVPLRLKRVKKQPSEKGP